VSSSERQFALRRWVSWLWIAATALGMAVGLTAGAALVDYGISRGDLVLMGAVTGVGVAGAGARTRPGLRRVLTWLVLAVLFRSTEPEAAR